MSQSSAWLPHARLISNVTNDTNATVATTTDHGYESGQYVMLEVPKDYGMYLPQVQAKIIGVLSPTEFFTDVNTILQPTFVTPGVPAFTQANCAPMTGNTRNVA